MIRSIKKEINAGISSTVAAKGPVVRGNRESAHDNKLKHELKLKDEREPTLLFTTHVHKIDRHGAKFALRIGNKYLTILLGALKRGEVRLEELEEEGKIQDKHLWRIFPRSVKGIDNIQQVRNYFLNVHSIKHRALVTFESCSTKRLIKITSLGRVRATGLVAGLNEEMYMRRVRHRKPAAKNRTSNVSPSRKPARFELQTNRGKSILSRENDGSLYVPLHNNEELSGGGKSRFSALTSKPAHTNNELAQSAAMYHFNSPIHNQTSPRTNISRGFKAQKYQNATLPKNFVFASNKKRQSTDSDGKETQAVEMTVQRRESPHLPQDVMVSRLPSRFSRYFTSRRDGESSSVGIDSEYSSMMLDSKIETTIETGETGAVRTMNSTGTLEFGPGSRASSSASPAGVVPAIDEERRRTGTLRRPPADVPESNKEQ
mmetsp:Transcript_24550/g.43571  ORF Transcript_24550/g.43571 Transcript_24550/m.43571 type:complete len:431 (+) Transcript_24550:2-1294(+)